MNFSTADLFDDFEDQLQSCDLSLQNFGGIKNFFGQISTIRCHEDNSLIRQTLSESGQGRVLVIDGTGSLRRALVGDVIAKLAPVATVGLESLCKVRFVTALQLVIYKLAWRPLVRILVEVPKRDLASKTYPYNLGTPTLDQTIGFVVILME